MWLSSSAPLVQSSSVPLCYSCAAAQLLLVWGLGLEMKLSIQCQSNDDTRCELVRDGAHNGCEAPARGLCRTSVVTACVATAHTKQICAVLHKFGVQLLKS